MMRLLRTEDRELQRMVPLLISSAVTVPLALLSTVLLGAATLDQMPSGLGIWAAWLAIYVMFFFFAPRKAGRAARTLMGPGPVYDIYYRLCLYSPAILAAVMIVSTIFYNIAAGGLLLGLFMWMTFGRWGARTNGQEAGKK